MSNAPAKHLELYRLIMTEIKERIAVLRAASEQKINVWPVAAYELGQLQLRLICELIGLGCLAAHGDIPSSYSRRLLTTYEPGKIFSELTKLHPNFFPRACSKTVQVGPGGGIGLSVHDEHMYPSKQELIAIHGKTGNVLHRGELRSVGRGFHLNFKELEEWHNKIVDMLSIHMISLHDPSRYVFVIMSDPNAGGGVSSAEVTMHHQSDGWEAQEAARRKPPTGKR